MTPCVDILLKNLGLIQSCHYKMNMDEKSGTIQRRLAEDSDFLKVAFGSGADLSNHYPAEVVLLLNA